MSLGAFRLILTRHGFDQRGPRSRAGRVLIGPPPFEGEHHVERSPIPGHLRQPGGDRADHRPGRQHERPALTGAAPKAAGRGLCRHLHRRPGSRLCGDLSPSAAAAQQAWHHADGGCAGAAAGSRQGAQAWGQQGLCLRPLCHLRPAVGDHSTDHGGDLCGNLRQRGAGGAGHHRARGAGDSSGAPGRRPRHQGLLAEAGRRRPRRSSPSSACCCCWSSAFR